METCFHDQLVLSDMEIVEHLVVDNQVVEGDDSYVVKNLVVSNEIDGGESLSYVGEGLHIVVDIDVATEVELDVIGVDLLVASVVEDLHDTMDLHIPNLPMVDIDEDLQIPLSVDLGLHVVELVLELHDVDDMDFTFENIYITSCD